MNNPEIDRFIDAFDRLESLVLQDGESKLTPEDRDALKFFMADAYKRSVDFDELNKDRERLWCQLADLNDPTPLTIEDVERMLGVKRQVDSREVFIADFSFVFTLGRELEAWSHDEDGADFIMLLTTHGKFRTFCRLFGIETKEQNS